VPPIGGVQTFEGNPDIQPEDIVSYEFGLRSQFNNGRDSSDVKLFTYRISGHINGAPTGNLNILGNSIDTTANQDSTRVTGLELALNFSPTPNLDIKSGFSFVDAESTKDDFERSVPDKTAFVNADYRWNPRHDFSVSFYYIDAMQWLDTADINAIEPIRKLDLRYAYTLDERSETRIELIGQNLLEDYNDYFLDNLAEPVFLLRISGSF
jgi:outer membrane receptor protein involved in Fe transport